MQSAVLVEEFKAAGKRLPESYLRIAASKPRNPTTGEPMGGLVFPPQVGTALGDNPRRPGLHNSAALMMKHSPVSAWCCECMVL
jgi:hypothetical protein